MFLTWSPVSSIWCMVSTIHGQPHPQRPQSVLSLYGEMHFYFSEKLLLVPICWAGLEEVWLIWVPGLPHVSLGVRLLRTDEDVLCAKSFQSCPTLCDPMNCSPSGSSVHEISQARLLEWVVISLSRGSSWPSDRTRVSCIGRHVLYCWATRSPYVHAYILYILASLVAQW